MNGVSRKLQWLKLKPEVIDNKACRKEKTFTFIPTHYTLKKANSNGIQDFETITYAMEKLLWEEAIGRLPIFDWKKIKLYSIYWNKMKSRRSMIP